jgi:hypothetical protein
VTTERRPPLALVPNPGGDEARLDASDRADAAAARQGGELVRAALAGQSLDPIDHELLLALSLGEELATIPDAERRAAAELAASLDRALANGPRLTRPEHVAAPAGGEGDRDIEASVELCLALRAAASPRALDELANERVLQRALRQQGARRRSTRAWMLFSSAVAVAAGIALFVTSPAWRAGERGSGVAEGPRTPAALAPPAALIPARSTQSLFDPGTKFPVRGGESSRVDKIASARMAELRANRYAQWGVP